jgi:DNA polymerase I
MWSEPGQPSKPSSRPGLLLVDGHAYAYRAFHAIRRLNGPDGRPSNALFGFTKMLDRLISWLVPTHAAVVWDCGMSAERLQALPDYKADRPPMPDDLHAQITELQRYLPLAGLQSIQLEGAEADDCLASIAVRAQHAIASTWIASSDKDFMQLVRPGIGLVNPADMPPKIWTDQDVIAKTGVRPEQIVDWLSLIGDAVDNIPGVSGVGPKTATKLLRQFGSIAEIYRRIEEVDPLRLREELRQSAQLVARNQKLICLDDKVGATITLAELTLKKPDNKALAAWRREWGFRVNDRTDSANAEPSEKQQDLFAPHRA